MLSCFWLFVAEWRVHGSHLTQHTSKGWVAYGGQHTQAADMWTGVSRANDPHPEGGPGLKGEASDPEVTLCPTHTPLAACTHARSVAQPRPSLACVRRTTSRARSLRAWCTSAHGFPSRWSLCSRECWDSAQACGHGTGYGWVAEGEHPA